jgi:hypothetical protein
MNWDVPILMGDQMRRAFEDWLGAECAAREVQSEARGGG